jgi:hypothetical protein
MPHGVMLGAISVSIFIIGAAAFHFIQGIESRYGIGGSGSMSLVLASAVLGDVSKPHVASDGIANADASKAVSRRRTT